MNKAKCNKELYCDFLIADDTVLDKPFGDNIGLSQWQYSGTHHRVVHGIGLETLLWTDGSSHVPVDYRLYAKKEDGYTKNQYFQEMTRLASHRGFHPQGVLMDAWYSTVANLKTLDSIGWTWITELQANRNVSLEPHKYLRVDSLDYGNNEDGINAHLKGYGFIKVFKITAPKGRIGYFATPDQTKTSKDIKKIFKEAIYSDTKDFNCVSPEKVDKSGRNWLK